jgi:excinuclease ABC subunit C
MGDVSETDISTEDTQSPKDPPVLKGVEVIAREVKRLPNGPGVYRMLDENGDVLYVGKASEA